MDNHLEYGQGLDFNCFRTPKGHGEVLIIYHHLSILLGLVLKQNGQDLETTPECQAISVPSGAPLGLAPLQTAATLPVPQLSGRLNNHLKKDQASWVSADGDPVQ